MCGFAGVLDFAGAPDRSLVERMGASLAHRGPDQGACHVHRVGHLGIAVSSRRLAILDLSSAGDQPMHSQDGRHCLAYNGELYNEPQLRRGLESRGYQFLSGTDTETVLHAYRDRGIDSFADFNGMFALAIVDEESGRLVLARDRMGIKPLYYSWNGTRLLFASELRTLLRVAGMPFRIDPASLEIYLALGYVPSPHSLVRDIYKVPPAGCLTIDAHGQLTLSEFWRPPVSADPPDERSPVEQTVRDTVLDAVRRQMRSDVPVGILLSGGVDSTIVALSAAAVTEKPINTFTVSFQSARSGMDPDLNADAEYARRVSAQMASIHHEVILDDNADLAALLPKLAVGLDEPVWEASFVSIYAISKLARDHGIKVLLTGDGSDELFLGYPWHASAWRQEKYERLPFLAAAASVATGLLPRGSRLAAHAENVRALVNASDAARYEWSHRIFSRAERRGLLGAGGSGSDEHVNRLVERLAESAHTRPLGERMALLDLLLWVREHFNQRLDRMTMLNSVEARVPFQDNNVVDLALRLPYHVRAPRGRAKHLLKAAFRTEVPSFVLERPKRPFAAPMRAWLDGPLRPLIADVLAPASIRRAGLVEVGPAMAVLSGRGSVAEDRWVRQVWSLLMIHLWADGFRRAQ